MSKKIFFLDLDDTLLTTDKHISETTYDAISHWCGKGNLIAVNSGRPMRSVMDTMKELKLDVFEESYAIAFDGAWIKDVHSGKDIVKKTVEMRDVYAASKVLQDAGIHVHAYSDDSIITCADDEEIHFYTRTVKLPWSVLPGFPKGLEKEPCKILGVTLKPEKLDHIMAAIKEACEGRVDALMSNPHLLEIFPSSAGKGTAVKELAELLGVDLKDTFAAGDAGNDISMIQTAGCGIAMINGTDDVKAAADVITETDNNHDGLVPFFLKG